MKLESIVPGSRVSGLSGKAAVETLSSRAYGPDALEVAWKGPDGLGERILFRDDEPRLRMEDAARRFAFDGDGHLFRLASEALRIRLAHLFDPRLAVHASRIEPLPHQLTAVYGEMLDRQPLRFLLADDPGAGKTVMAGLLIKELLIRGSLERCLIVAPGGLVEQWQNELADKFDLAFDILSREQVETSATGNPFADKPRLIARLDMLARNDDLKARLEAAPVWDLIVCDEAHRMSASFFGQEVKYTKRFQLGALAGRLARHFVLMTATPHNGKEEDFQLFMGLLDADRFEGRFREGVHKADPSDMMRRLTKEELVRLDGSPLFPERRAYTVSYRLSPGEAALYGAVTRYVQEEMNRADRIGGAGGGDGSRRRNNVGFALQTLQRKADSTEYLPIEHATTSASRSRPCNGVWRLRPRPSTNRSNAGARASRRVSRRSGTRPPVPGDRRGGRYRAHRGPGRPRQAHARGPGPGLGPGRARGDGAGGGCNRTISARSSRPRSPRPAAWRGRRAASSSPASRRTSVTAIGRSDVPPVLPRYRPHWDGLIP